MESTIVSRRSFVKAATAIGAAAALAGAVAAKPQKAFAEAAKGNAANEGVQGEVFGHCRMCMLCGSCSFLGTVKDGVVVNIEGDPDRMTNAGGLCPRGKSAIMNLYNPYRIKAPMKRTNPEKGMEVDPGWVEITWDEALDAAAAAVGGCLAEDPRTLVHIYSFAAYESSHATMGQGTWGHVLQTPNVTSVKGQMCAIHYGGMYTMTAAPTVNYDGKYDEYVVVMGKSLGYDNGYGGGDARTYANMVRRGGKFVVVGPRATMEASRGEWVSCKPATELALVYAWLHEMLWEMECGIDVPFVKSRTNSPYLIGPDGFYVTDAEGKPYIWDAADETAKAFDDSTLTDPALEGVYEVNGVSCQPGLALVKEAVKDFTCEWAEPITTVPAETIRRIVNELVEHSHFGSTIEIDGAEMPFRPACLVIGRGCTNQQVGTLIDIWSREINILLGNAGYPGGIMSTMRTEYFVNPVNGTIEPFGEAATMQNPPTWPPQALDYSDYLPHKHSSQTLMWHVLADTERYGIDYIPKVLVSSAANPVVGSDSADLVIDGLKKFETVVYQACYHMDEMAMMSDILLPEHAALEQHTCHQFPGNECSSTAEEEGFEDADHAIVVRKGIAPMYNTMDGNDQLIEIFDRMGLIHVWNGMIDMVGAIGFAIFNSIGMFPFGGVPFKDPQFLLDPNTKYTAEEIFDMNLKSQFGPDKGLDYLDEVKFIPFSIVKGKDNYTSYRNSTARFQVYLESQLRSGRVLVPPMREFPVDMGDLLGIELDELERRFQPIPHYPDPSTLVIENEPAEFDLRAVTYRQPLFMFRMASMDQDPIRRDYAEKYIPDNNAILVHPQTAVERGIEEGDRVHVRSPYGETWGSAHLTQTIRPDSVAIGGMRGRKTTRMGKDLLNDTNFNDLLSGDFGHTDPLDAAEIIQVNVKIEKA